MINYAGRNDVDEELTKELREAGIIVRMFPEDTRNSTGEVQTVVRGSLHGWRFGRAWRYWTAEGPGIEVEAAEELHTRLGKVVRVAGHCGCPSPREWFNGGPCTHYHIDTEEGLKALADAIKREANKEVRELKKFRVEVVRTYEERSVHIVSGYTKGQATDEAVYGEGRSGKLHIIKTEVEGCEETSLPETERKEER